MHMISSSQVIDIPLEISSLCELVKNNKIDAITAIIKKEKSEKGWQWQYSHPQYLVESAMRDAILLKKIDIVKIFINEGVSVNGSAPITTPNGYNNRYIGFAAKSGNLAMVQFLVECGADVLPHNSYFNEGDDSGISAAVEAGHADIVEYLLQKGATARGVIGQRSDERDTFLAYAAKQGHTQIIELLIQYGAQSSLEDSLYLAYEKYGKSIIQYEFALKEKFSNRNRDAIVKNISGSDFMRSYHEEELKKFDEAKPRIAQQRNENILIYEKIITTLMDYAIGCDFSYYTEKDILKFLTPLRSIAALNFVGVSIGGYPITPDMLIAAKFPRAAEAIVTLTDFSKILTIERRQALQRRLDTAMKKYGALVRESIVNLIPLWRAVERKDFDAVKVRLAAGIDPNEKGDDLPIVLAVKNNHEEIIDALRYHPRFDIKTLSLAIKAAHQSNNQKLAERLTDTQDINQLDGKGEALLHHAVREGNVEKVTKLIARGADVNLKGSNGYPLAIAARHSYDIEWDHKASADHIKILRILLEHQASPDLSYYGTAMDNAGKAGSAEALAILLPITKKQDIVKKTSDTTESLPWYTDIMFESFRSSEWIEVLKLLIAQGADINLCSGGYVSETLLHRVMRTFPSKSSVSSAMRDILRSVEGCDVPHTTLSKTHKDLIENSQNAFFNHLRRFDFLLENGANPSVKAGNNQCTPLHLLVEKVDLDHIVNGYPRIIDKCLTKGFDINSKDADGKTLLHIAAASGDLPAIKYLLTRGAEINIKDNKGRTPLHFAAAGNPASLIPHASPRTTEYLLKQGANPDSQMLNNYTPYLYSQAVALDWIKTASFKAWEGDVQKDWMQPFEKTWKILLEKPEDEKKAANDEKLSAETQTYIESFNTKESNKKILEKLDLSVKEINLLENYRDDISHEIMEIPVLLNERVYDFMTLRAIFENSKKDPFTGAIFYLSDITPAKTVAREIAVVMRLLQENHPFLPNKSIESNLSTIGLLANKTKQVNLSKEESPDKKKKASCITS